VPDELSDYEGEFADVEDPSPWHPDFDFESHGEANLQHLAALIDGIVEDLVHSLNKGKGPIGQYLYSNGMSLSFQIVGPHTMELLFQLPAVKKPLIQYVEDDSGEATT
jgi:hypothetical protein